MNQSDYRPVDKIVGIILIFYSLCGVLCGGFVAGLGTLLGFAAATTATDANNQHAAAPLGLAAGGALLIGISIAGAYLLAVAGAIGVMKSRRWGFMVIAILTGITALGSLSGTTGFINLLPDIAACVYCILRLTGNLPPQPD